MCAATSGERAWPRRDLRTAVTPASHDAEGGSTMKNLIAPLGLTVLSAWVVLLFVLASHNTP
ncbi:hypothetical protein GCM10010168_90190 [Actinoplanes ianthinogenes]|nr:hypothetical protein Aiant_62580 [Actinoplanes ianthinogenes]GGR57212.1 hypothetical protein GCM10010168_90190 [Actinoplanes ianthinogenes]